MTSAQDQQVINLNNETNDSSYAIHPIVIDNQALSNYVTASELQNTQWTSWLGITVVSLTLIITWILHISMIVSISRSMIMKHITYFYISSLGFVIMLHSMLNFPVNIISNLIGDNEYIENFCCISIAAETTVCHAILLHLLGSSLDTYFRLTKPRWFTSTKNASGKHGLTIQLKIAAPWIVSILQTGAQIILSDPFPPAYLEDGRFCTSPDINFLILRTLVAFLLPLLTSIVILFMSAHQIQKLQRQQHLTQCHSGTQFSDCQVKKSKNVNVSQKNKSTCCLITFCIDSCCKSVKQEETEIIPFSFSNQHCCYDYKKTCDSLNKCETFQTEYKNLHEIHDNKLVESRCSRVETNFTAANYEMAYTIVNDISSVNTECSPEGRQKSSSHIDHQSPIPLRLPSSSAITNFQYQQGSSSSDAGISSQTTEDTDEFTNHNWLTYKGNHCCSNDNNSPNINSDVQNPWEILNNEHLTETLNGNNPYQKLVKHFCPQHGQVMIPEHVYKPVLSVVQEVDMGQCGNQGTQDLPSQGGVTISPSQQDKNLPVHADNIPLSLPKSTTFSSPVTAHIIFNQLCNLERDNNLLKELSKQNNALPHYHSKDRRQGLQQDQPKSGFRSRETSEQLPEQKSVKLNMILCAITIAMWSPFITASLSHLLLSNSSYFHLLSVGTLIQFKWLAYMSSVAYPVGFLLVDSQLCKATFSQIYCRKL
ncbi:unnamed protein product [Heterobilharzia americana]|nr:unnamed protein product [Heterobilharzia americana]